MPTYVPPKLQAAFALSRDLGKPRSRHGVTASSPQRHQRIDLRHAIASTVDVLHLSSTTTIRGIPPLQLPVPSSMRDFRPRFITLPTNRTDPRPSSSFVSAHSGLGSRLNSTRAPTGVMSATPPLEDKVYNTEDEIEADNRTVIIAQRKKAALRQQWLGDVAAASGSSSGSSSDIDLSPSHVSPQHTSTKSSKFSGLPRLVTEFSSSPSSTYLGPDDDCASFQDSSAQEDVGVQSKSKWSADTDSPPNSSVLGRTGTSIHPITGTSPHVEADDNPAHPRLHLHESEVFIPSAQFHDNIESEGPKYQSRVEENVKKYRHNFENSGDGENRQFGGESIPEEGSTIPPDDDAGSSSVSESDTPEHDDGPTTEDEPTTDEESITNYTHGHPLQRMPGKVKGFNVVSYYHHKFHSPPPNVPGKADSDKLLPHHYFEPWHPLHLSGEDDSTTNGATGIEKRSTTSDNRDEDDHDGEGARSEGDQDLKASKKTFHLPMTCIWSETGHDVRILLRGMQSRILAKKRAGEPTVEVSEDTLRILSNHQYHIDSRNLIVYTPPKNRPGLTIKQLSLESPELLLLLELNQPETRNDPWNHIPPIVAVMEAEPDFEAATGDLDVQLVLGHLETLDSSKLEFVGQYVDLFRQLLAGLSFLSGQRIAGLNCASPDSFVVEKEGSDLGVSGDQLPDLLSTYLRGGASTDPGGLSSGASTSSVGPSYSSGAENDILSSVWRDNAPRPRYYFVNFSDARRISSLGPPQLQSKAKEDPTVAPVRAPFDADVQKDVMDLGVLFFDLIESSPPSVRQMLNAHFTLLIQAMSDGGFTAEEARRLCEMITSNWARGSRFTFVPGGGEVVVEGNVVSRSGSLSGSETEGTADEKKASGSKVAPPHITFLEPEQHERHSSLIAVPTTRGFGAEDGSEDGHWSDVDLDIVEDDISRPNYCYGCGGVELSGSEDGGDVKKGVPPDLLRRGRAGTIVAKVATPAMATQREIDIPPRSYD